MYRVFWAHRVDRVHGGLGLVPKVVRRSCGCSSLVAAAVVMLPKVCYAAVYAWSPGIGRFTELGCLGDWR